jgi:hypothetical protein
MAPSDMLPDAKLERSRPEVGRAFGFLVHDVSRLIKRRFERRARQMGLQITRQQAAVVLNIAGEALAKPSSRPGSTSSRSPSFGCLISFMRRVW